MALSQTKNRITVAVQHHPRRGALLADLLEGLAGMRVEVVTDPDPNAHPSPWRTYRACLEAVPSGSTHHIVVQDDTYVCDHFAETVELAVAARPDRMLSLCVCGEPLLSAMRIWEAGDRGEHWAALDMDRWIPAIATVWPVRLIEPFLEYVDAQNWPVMFTADDEILGRVMRALNEPVLATVPSLIMHDDDRDSLIGRRTMYGADPGRVTACPPVPDCDLRLIDWNSGANV